MAKFDVLGHIYNYGIEYIFPQKNNNKPGTKTSTTTTSVETPVEPIPSTSGQATQEDSAEVGQTLDILDDPLLSPRAVRQREIDVVVPTIEKKETGVQCDILVGIPYTGIEKQCRMCGAVWEQESRTRKLLWVGCEARNCKYWVHGDCLLGKSSKLTPEFLENMPFKCYKHR